MIPTKLYPTVARVWRLDDIRGIITIHCTGLRNICFDMFLCTKCYLAVVPLGLIRVEEEGEAAMMRT